MNLIYQITCIAGGILLGIDTLDKWDGSKDFFKKAEQFLMPYNTIIGGIIFILSILNLIRPGCMLGDLVGIAAGLLLFTEILTKIPAIGELLMKVSGTLTPFKAIIGVAILILGLAGVLGIHLLC